MANYSAIFFFFLAIDVVLTIRASPTLYPKLAALLTSSSSSLAQSDRQSLMATGGNATEAAGSASYQKLLVSYLIVYLLATCSDWLQGPYVYALYDAYGYTPHEIAVLFVAGFGSSMIFGSFVGGMADTCGRKKFVLLFCIIYGAGCLTKHVRDFRVLLLGRLLGGIATSLLFSVFDTWYIKAHNTEKLEKELISNTFSYAAYGNSIVAILAGLFANKVANSNGGRMVNWFDPDVPFDVKYFEGSSVDTASWVNKVYQGGFIYPFDTAFAALVACFVMATLLWEENYGELPVASQQASSPTGLHVSSSMSDDGVSGEAALDAETAKQGRKANDQSLLAGWKRAVSTVATNREVLICGMVSSLFEGSMYVFVFMWTRSLQSLTPGSTGSSGGHRQLQESLPFGLIFSTFMVSCMTGSSVFSIVTQSHYMSLETLGIYILGVAAASMAIVALSSSDSVTFVAMNVFEMTVGMYFPTMGTLKSSIVPENSRSAIYNLYRIPLNFIVLTSLLTDLSVRTSFVACFTMLSLATFLQHRLQLVRVTSAGKRSTSNMLQATQPDV